MKCSYKTGCRETEGVEISTVFAAWLCPAHKTELEDNTQRCEGPGCHEIERLTWSPIFKKWLCYTHLNHLSEMESWRVIDPEN